jgi:hypothetical protein
LYRRDDPQADLAPQAAFPIRLRWIDGMGTDAYHGDGWSASGERAKGGWGFLGYGNIASGSRFWVAISDQPANCWD